MDRHKGKALFMAFIAGILAACTGERPNNLGMVNGVLAPCPSSPNCVSSMASDPGHRIEPIPYRSDARAAFVQLRETLARRSDATLVEEKYPYLRVELRTNFFVDDGEFLLDEKQGVIHVRSASRVGYSDLGKNRKRMEEIRSEFSASGGKS
jgi:uncharacterized protein (DUF1499 family)